MTQVCIVTATRAEYGLLKPVIEKLNRSLEFEVKLVVTGMHLSPEFGLTYQEIENDNLKIDKKIEMLLSADTSSAISKSMGLALISFADYFADNKFDSIILLGDRYETLAVACAAMNAQLPIVHLQGGETTEGAIDEGIRHAITKLSFLHLTSTEDYRKRVIQMGESPERVFCVGALGVENALNTCYLELSELSKQLGMDLCRPYALVTFHPVTLEEGSAESQTRELLSALDAFKELNYIITKANADKEGRIINKLLENYALGHNNVKIFDSLGTVRYLSVMKNSEMVIGNSSSGLIETPSFCIPTVNIGDRQRGRIKADSVIDCQPEREAIISAIMSAQNTQFREKIKNTINPYGDGDTSDKVVQILKDNILEKEIKLKKKFFDIF